jgi:hypothetical protein
MKLNTNLYNKQDQCTSLKLCTHESHNWRCLTKLTFNILNIKYDIILKMFWLHNRNFEIDWVNKKLYVTEHTYEILKQLEMCLSEHKSWNYEILLLKKNNLSECHYIQWVRINSEKSETILIRISKENSSNH